MPIPAHVLDAIRQRPGLFFGHSPPLSALCHYIMGYEHGTKDLSTLPSDFSGWVAYRTGASRTYNWLGMLLSVSADEVEAFRRFFELWDEHKARNARLIARVTGHGKTRGSIRSINFDCPEGTPFSEAATFDEKALPDPILILTYTDDPGFLAQTENEGYFGIWGYWKSWDELAKREGFLEEHVEILDAEEFERIRHTRESRASNRRDPWPP
ncbi:MAG TPA: hypothetical protein VGE67_01665 [Haloferula sp.]